MTLIRISPACASSMSVSVTYAYVQSATRMIAGIAVQTTSRRVLPWIGGPSASSSPGRWRNFQTENSTTTVTRTNTGTDTMIRTSYSVSIFDACVDAGVGNQSMIRPSAMPSAEAIAPMIIIWAMEACPSGRTSSGVLVLAPSRVVSSSAMGPGEYASRPMDGNEGETGVL